MNKDLGIFIQARMGSTRLPGKIFKDIGGRPALKIMIDNLKNIGYSDLIYILTSTEKQDNVVEDFATMEGVKCFRGSENDVLDRFFQAAKKNKINDIVRLTGDCPFLSMKVFEENINSYYKYERPDYFFAKDYPNGLGAVEIMSFDAVQKAHEESVKVYHREHVMTYLEDNPDKFRVVIEDASGGYNRPDIRLTLDEEKDLDLLRIVYKKLGGIIDLDSIVNLFNQEPELIMVNKEVKQKTI